MGMGLGYEKGIKTAGDFTGGGGGGTWDDFFVDQLLDFSNGYSETEDPPPENEPENVETAHQKQTRQVPENCYVIAEDDFGSLQESELSVEGESLESLEWVSQFVEDSFPDYSLTGKIPTAPLVHQPEPPSPAECFAAPVQTKARTKRARVRVWPVMSPSSAEPDTSPSSSASSTTSFSPPNKSMLKPAYGGLAAAAQRRCTHCGVTKTPQWRAGPHGLKSLCNACGVRYKSGRLLPEYRPACSPTFSSELHSSNHRKVLEMRRKKEVKTEGVPHPVQSF